MHALGHAHYFTLYNLEKNATVNSSVVTLKPLQNHAKLVCDGNPLTILGRILRMLGGKIENEKRWQLLENEPECSATEL